MTYYAQIAIHRIKYKSDGYLVKKTPFFGYNSSLKVVDMHGMTDRRRMIDELNYMNDFTLYIYRVDC